MKYLITFFPRCKNSELNASEVSNIIFEAESIEHAIDLFISKADEEVEIRMFIGNFYYYIVDGSGMPNVNKDKITHTIKKLNTVHNKLNLKSKDIDDPEHSLFISEYVEYWKFLISSYNAIECDYFKICKYETNKCLTDGLN
jgi:hypothetical protein